MLTYVGIFLFFAFCCFVTRNWPQEKAYIVIASIFLVLFVGSRLNTGCDFQAYYLRFTGLNPNEAFMDVIRRDEPGFWIIAYLVKALGLEYVWVNLIGATIFFFCTARFVLRHPNPALLLAIMFPILVVQLSMSGLRQAIAVAFFMLAILAFFDTKRWHVIGYILIGSVFHESLILFLPLSLAIGREFSVKRLVAAMVVISPVALIFSADRLDVYNDRYVEQIYGEMESSGAVFRLGLLVLSALVFEFYRDPIKKMFPGEYNLMRMFSLLSFTLIPIALVSTVVVHRIGYYVLPVQLFTLALIPFAAFPNLREINFGQVFPIGIYAAYIIVWFSFSSHAESCYIPYRSFLTI